MNVISKEYRTDPEPCLEIKFIALHIRRTDFASWCDAAVAYRDCLPQSSAFQQRIDEIIHELATRPSNPVVIDPSHVLLTTDEPRDPSKLKDSTGRRKTDEELKEWRDVSVEFWEDAETRGWKSLDHDKEGTAETYGK